MSNIKKILIPGFVPSPTSFGNNEIIINPIDGKLYIRGTDNNTLRVINQNSDKDIPLDGNILINKKIEFKETKNSDSILFISSSGKQSRIGIGTNDPKSSIDFKTIEDSAIGTEIVLRTARTNRGAFTGDEGGSINFTIDSGSYANLKTEGSLAKIKTIVNEVGVGGAQGLLAFTLSKGAGGDGIDAFKYGYAIGGEITFAQIQTGSLLMHDFSGGQPARLNMNDSNGDTTFEVFKGNITASGDISASGELYGNQLIITKNIPKVELKTTTNNVYSQIDGTSGNIRIDVDNGNQSGNSTFGVRIDAAGTNQLSLNTNGELTLTGGITASGDISASGDLYGDNLNLAGSVLGNSLTLDSSGDAQIVLDRGSNSDDAEIIFKTNNTENWSFGTGQIGGDASLTMRRNSTNYFQLDEGGNLELLGNISASGNISCSGDIIGTINGGSF